MTFGKQLRFSTNSTQPWPSENSSDSVQIQLNCDLRKTAQIQYKFNSTVTFGKQLRISTNSTQLWPSDNSSDSVQIQLNCDLRKTTQIQYKFNSTGPFGKQLRFNTKFNSTVTFGKQLRFSMNSTLERTDGNYWKLTRFTKRNICLNSNERTATTGN